MSDDFRGRLGIQWQWQANPNPAWYREGENGLTLYAAPSDSLFHAGQFLSQLMQRRNFDWDVGLTLHAAPGARAGVGMMGSTYYYLMLESGRVALMIGQATEINRWERERVTERTLAELPWPSESAYFRMSVRNGRVSFLCGSGESELAPLGDAYPMACGGWVSARPGIFCMNHRGAWDGSADFAFCRVTDGGNRL